MVATSEYMERLRAPRVMGWSDAVRRISLMAARPTCWAVLPAMGGLPGRL
jgi:hypothetical protein